MRPGARERPHFPRTRATCRAVRRRTAGRASATAVDRCPSPRLAALWLSCRSPCGGREQPEHPTPDGATVVWHLLHGAREDDEDPRGECQQLVDVGGVDDYCGSRAGRCTETSVHHRACLDVEATCRILGHEQVGSVLEFAREHELLLVPAG